MNIKELLTKNLNKVFSYIGAEPQSSFNHIYTNPSNKRTYNNGFAQFTLQANINKSIERLSLRVENHCAYDKLTLIEKKISNLMKSSLMIFGYENSVFISKSSAFGHDWIEDDKYYKAFDLKTSFGLLSVREYDINLLLKDNKIFQLMLNEVDKKLVVFSGELTKGKTKEFAYNEYNEVKDELEALYVQSDPRSANTVYYTFFGERFTNIRGTVPALASYFAMYSKDKDENAEKRLKQRMHYAKNMTMKTGKAIPVEIELNDLARKNLSNDAFFSGCLSDKGNLIIYISTQKDFDVIENEKKNLTSNVDYKKLYDKVAKYLARHNHSMNPKWGNEEIDIANKILNKLGD